MNGHHRLAPSPELRRHWRLVRGLLIALIAAVCIGSWWLLLASGTPATPAGATALGTTQTVFPTTAPKVTLTTSGAPIDLTASGPGWLTPGSNPAVLPGPILIADGGGNRVLIIDQSGRSLWLFPRPGDLSSGQTFKAPEAAWFSPDGKQVVVDSEDSDSLYVIDIATHKMVYQYGTPDTAGSGPNMANAPDGVVMTASHSLLVPDAGNCRIITIPAGSHSPSQQLGQTGVCVHHPPQTFSDPAGLFPMSDGDFLLTEGTGNWVTEMSTTGKVKWSIQVPGVQAIYETSEIGPDRYLTADHASPGQVLTFTHTGKVLWRYAPTGSQALDNPSMVIGMPNGDVIISDKGDNRLIVVDPRTNKVMWQYGHVKVAGSTPGFLNGPTGVDLYPPNALSAKIK